MLHIISLILSALLALSSIPIDPYIMPKLNGWYMQVVDDTVVFISPTCAVYYFDYYCGILTPQEEIE